MCKSMKIETYMNCLEGGMGSAVFKCRINFPIFILAIVPCPHHRCTKGHNSTMSPPQVYQRTQQYHVPTTGVPKDTTVPCPHHRCTKGHNSTMSPPQVYQRTQQYHVPTTGVPKDTTVPCPHHRCTKGHNSTMSPPQVYQRTQQYHVPTTGVPKDTTVPCSHHRCTPSPRQHTNKQQQMNSSHVHKHTTHPHQPH